ncbi:MAG: TetR/AcrR family transcriptional regulator [Oscillospiraceae bacterium]|nr:TetR/AcrR family transcriptional regulator [Oscillospiraceae bacterium]
MPAPVKISQEAILAAGLELARSRGLEGLNARALAMALGCSTQPIFKNFASMEALREAVLAEAHRRYREKLAAEMAASPYPPYKASGMAYIAFARTEPQLFRLLFMRNRQGPEEGPETADWQPDTALAGRSAGLSPEEAQLFHLEMWAVVHGLAVMQATGYLRLEEETLSRLLTDAFQGVKSRWEEKARERH